MSVEFDPNEPERMAALDEAGKWKLKVIDDYLYLQDQLWQYETSQLDPRSGSFTLSELSARFSVLCDVLRSIDGAMQKPFPPEENQFTANENYLNDARYRLLMEAEAAKYLRPKGPTLTTDDLHPAIWSAAMPHFSMGMFHAGVFAAVRVWIDYLKARTDRADVNDKDLIKEVFSDNEPQLDKPRLRFNPVVLNSDKLASTMRAGIRDLSAGVVSAIRNPVVHHEVEIDEQDALTTLVVISYVYRLAEKCTLMMFDRGDGEIYFQLGGSWTRFSNITNL